MPDNVLCGDIKVGMLIHSELLKHLDATLRQIIPDLRTKPLDDWTGYGGTLPVDWPPIVQEVGCRVAADVPSVTNALTLASTLTLMRALLQLPWAVLSSLGDEYVFELPAVIMPLGLPLADEANA
jgi:hypothetical protein